VRKSKLEMMTLDYKLDKLDKVAYTAISNGKPYVPQSLATPPNTG